MATVGAPKRTAPSLALEAAALAYAAAVDTLERERVAVIADHFTRTGSRTGAFTTSESETRIRPLIYARDLANEAMGRAAVALWKAERLRSGGGRAKL